MFEAIEEEIKKNANRYELLRDIKINELMQAGKLPCPIEEAYDWFDAQVDRKIKNIYPGAEIF